MKNMKEEEKKPLRNILPLLLLLLMQFLHPFIPHLQLLIQPGTSKTEPGTSTQRKRVRDENASRNVT